MDRLAAEAEIPIDHLDRTVQHQLLESGLFSHFAPRGIGRGFIHFQVTLGESPILVRVANQEEAHLSVRAAAEDNAAGAGLALRAGLGFATFEAAGGQWNSKCGMWNAEFLK